MLLFIRALSTSKAYPATPVRRADRQMALLKDFQLARKQRPESSALLAVEQLVLDSPAERITAEFSDTALKFLAKNKSKKKQAVEKLVDVAVQAGGLQPKTSTGIAYSLGMGKLLSEVPAGLVEKLDSQVDRFNTQDLAYATLGLGKLHQKNINDLVQKLESQAMLQEKFGLKDLSKFTWGLAALRGQPASEELKEKLTSWTNTEDNNDELKNLENPDLVTLIGGFAVLFPEQVERFAKEAERRKEIKAMDLQRLSTAYINAGLSVQRLDKFARANAAKRDAWKLKREYKLYEKAVAQ